MREIHLRAPASIGNVGPGYDIFALSLEEPCDEIKIELNNSNKIVLKIIGNNQSIPVAIDENTAGLAISELLRRKNISIGVNLEIIKKMPSGCGLGTTGASAAACVFGLNKLLDLNLSDNEMIDIARRGEVASGGSPHADNVAASILGGFILIKSYNPIEVLKLKISEFPIVLAIMKKSQRTTRGFITYDIGEEKLKEQIAHCSNVIHAIHTQDIEEFGKAISIDHVAEPIRGATIPEYYKIKKKILDAGALGFNISGGGSSVFAVCVENKIDEIADLMENEFSLYSNFIEVIKTKTSNIGIREVL